MTKLRTWAQQQHGRQKALATEMGVTEETVALAFFREIADGYIMQQSIRNEIPGTVKEIISDKVLSEIIVETRIGEMAAVITTRSVQDMGLKVGDRVAALVKATNVSLRRPRF